MSSKPTEQASGLTMALTGMSLAVGIAREATDAVPIVKQCLGSAVRIVAFAEKMDKDRQALRDLADKSLQLARRVKDVMAGRTPDATVESSLERILRALETIETFMQKHSARSGLYRLVAYAFTVPQHVERLSRELTDAVQELIVVALLDVSHHVHATRTAVDDNSRYVGEFRLLRHCEVQKLERVFPEPQRYKQEKNTVFRYHRALVDGQLLVVRYFEGSIPHHSSSIQSAEDNMLDNIAFYDSILEEISTVQRSHPNVARMYGWSRGSSRDRFTVFKAGYQPFETLLGKVPNPIVTGIHWAFKVLDAVRHLELMGIVWKPDQGPYALDDQLQPMIGLQNDLYRTNQNMDQVFVVQNQIYKMILPLLAYAETRDVPSATIRKLLAGCLKERLSNLLGRMETIQRDRYMIPRAEFSDRHIITDSAAKRLLRILEEEAVGDVWRNGYWVWANMLLALDKNRSHPFMRSLRAVYDADRIVGDTICHGIDEDPERIVHDGYRFDVSHEQQDEVREMFGISAPSGELFSTSRLIATGTYSMLLD